MASIITPRPELRDTEPIKTLLSRVREELAADFSDDLPIRVSMAPGRLDVMGGIAGDTGSMVCQMPLASAAGVALQARRDCQLQVFSFNLLDEHKPFTLRIPIDALATQPAELLRQEFSQPGRKWAAYLAGCLFVLHAGQLVDLQNPAIAGINLAVYSTVPMSAGLGSSGAMEVAAMLTLADHFAIRDRLSPMRLAEFCQQVENQIAGVTCGIAEQATSCLGQAGMLLRMVCQPHEVLPPLRLPEGVRVLGINSNVQHDAERIAFAKAQSQALAAHRMILEKMREIGAAVGRELIVDPMNGYLANLDPEDYKRLFRPLLPEDIRSAADHHVLEARRVRRFCEFIEKANTLSGRGRTIALDSAGHLMYGSHQAYSQDAHLGCDECDLLVQLIRQGERAGFYGARITARGGGGTVALLANRTESADTAIGEILQEYERRTGRAAQTIAVDS